MEFNWLAIIVAAFVPTVLGFIWYNPKVFGTAWMKAAGMTDEKIKGGNMPLIFGLSLLFSVMLAMSMNMITIHQSAIYSVLMNEPGFGDPASDTGKFIADFMSKYGHNFRTFGHGAFHGILAGIFIILPVLATNAMFERKGFKYILLNAGYWAVCLAIMGGIICGWM
ncbi:MAG: DUF1761 domain-containing protein [Saprospiraceae bacterium]|nr:MAG: DUF1761 domain-containing protein [Saprospiraceae bacterium]